jgi:outer membrane immunogenic protein
MKRLLLCAIGFGTIAMLSNASAADMPLKAPPPPPPALWSWTGFYIGGNVGGSFGRATTNWNVSGVPLPSTSEHLDGFVGGGQAGYNWQSGRWVWGLETDIQGTSERGRSSNGDPVTTSLTTSTTTTTPCIPGALVVACGIPVTTTTTTTGTTTAALTSEEKLPWLGTVRARLGVLASPKWLLYATGGLAYGEVDSSGTLSAGGATVSGSSDTVRAGWTAGGGVEAALWGAWSLKAEYLFVDLGHVTNSYGGLSVATPSGTAVFSPVTTTSHVTDNIVRVGLDYHFNWR